MSLSGEGAHHTCFDNNGFPTAQLSWRIIRREKVYHSFRSDVSTFIRKQHIITIHRPVTDRYGESRGPIERTNEGLMLTDANDGEAGENPSTPMEHSANTLRTAFLENIIFTKKERGGVVYVERESATTTD